MITYLFSDFYFWTRASFLLLKPLSLPLFPFVQAAFAFELEANPPCNNDYDYDCNDNNSNNDNDYDNDYNSSNNKGRPQ